LLLSVPRRRSANKNAGVSNRHVKNRHVCIWSASKKQNKRQNDPKRPRLVRGVE